MRHVIASLPVLLAAAACASAPASDSSAASGAPKDAFCLVLNHPDVANVEYRDGDTDLQGHLAVPGAEFLRLTSASRVPAVLVVHEWWGRSPHADKCAEDLARLGYVGFAVDMYGEGRATEDPEQAGKWAGEIRKDPEKLRRRLRAALDLVRSLPHVDASRVACIGYCFGGTMSLEAAWAGFDLRGVVSFHGSLTAPTPEQAAGVKAAILVLHGADDDLVSAESIEAFVKSMRENRLDWQFVSYGGAVHSFTNPRADGSFNALVKHHPLSAARSWEAMKDFLAERFR